MGLDDLGQLLLDEEESILKRNGGLPRRRREFQRPVGNELDLVAVEIH